MKNDFVAFNNSFATARMELQHILQNDSKFITNFKKNRN